MSICFTGYYTLERIFYNSNLYPIAEETQDFEFFVHEKVANTGFWVFCNRKVASSNPQADKVQICRSTPEQGS